MMPPMESPHEQPLPSKDREALRARLIQRTAEKGYHPWLHLFGPAIGGVAIISFVLSTLENVQPLELLTIPLVFLLSNAVEWRAHKNLLHHRSRLIPILYDRHTPQHHMVFITDDLAARSRSEWSFVLIPAFGLALIGMLNLPIAAVLYYFVSHNVGALYLANALAYVLMYEWLHLSYHLPPESPIGKLSLIRFLRRHHATHHDPRLMQKWNFNVTIPLWDLVRSTYYGPPSSSATVASNVSRSKGLRR